VGSASQAVRGVPRMKELIHVSKNIKAPSCIIYLKEGINKDLERTKKVLNSLETTYLKDIVVSSRIYYDKNDELTDIEDDKLFLELYNMYSNINGCKSESPWLLRFEFNKEKMLELGLTMLDVSSKIYNFYNNNLSCTYSDTNASKLITRIRIVEDYDDMITELKALEQGMLESVIIKGIDRINKVVMRQEKIMRLSTEVIESKVKPTDLETVESDKKITKTFDQDYKVFINETEFVLDTDGTNLMEILGHNDVDETRTFSNDITEIYEIFGIEASREALIYEINEVLKGESVNYRHISLLVDNMTNKGHLLSIDRHGSNNRSDIGPLAKSSFEETSDMLIKAGVFSSIDTLNGVSGCIMLGKLPPCGTSEVQLFMDESELDKIDEVIEEEFDDNPESMMCEEGIKFNFDMLSGMTNEKIDDEEVEIIIT
jgi:DNA-directed RNA polymerase II subunit RPB1